MVSKTHKHKLISLNKLSVISHYKKCQIKTEKGNSKNQQLQIPNSPFPLPSYKIPITHYQNSLTNYQLSI